MANLNKVMLIGRLTRDPETVPFSNGGKVAKFGFAVNNRKLDQATNQWVDVPVFLDVEVFNRGENGKMADRVETTLRKGQQIFIEGHIRMDTWKSQEGQNRSKLVIVIENFQYLEPRQEGMGDGAPRAARPAQASPKRSEPTAATSSAGFSGAYDEESEPAAPRSNATEDDIPF